MRSLVLSIAIVVLALAVSAAPEDAKAAEHAAYLEAIRTDSPKDRATHLELFISQYPQGADVEPAFEALMKTYGKMGEVSKVEGTAHRLLRIEPKNLSALEVLTYLCLLGGEFPSQEEHAKWRTECKNVADGALSINEYDLPDPTSKQRFRKLRVEATKLFLQFEIPGDPIPSDVETVLQESPNDFGLVYPLALAYLTQPKPNCQKGLWYIARSAVLAPTPKYKKEIGEWGRKKTTQLHGDDNNWAELMSQAQKSPSPPTNFVIKCSID